MRGGPTNSEGVRGGGTIFGNNCRFLFYRSYVHTSHPSRKAGFTQAGKLFKKCYFNMSYIQPTRTIEDLVELSSNWDKDERYMVSNMNPISP